MPVTLCEWTLFTTEYRGRARWDHDFDIIAVRRDGVVGGSALIRAVRRYPVDPTFNLIQERRRLRRIVGILIREGLRHDHAITVSVPPCHRPCRQEVVSRSCLCR